MAKRKICIFSGKRGGFGAFVPLMRLIGNDPDLELQILLGDMHASKEFGETASEARRFFPNAHIQLIEMGAGRGDTPLIRTENLAACLAKSAQLLEKMKPDIVVVHADRGEHLMVAFAALNLGIPVAHTQGGEVSGNIDDIQRHAVSKLAHLHFPETTKAAERIVKLGEEPWRIHTVGSLYIDRIVKKMYPPLHTVRAKYGLGKHENYFLSIFHPDTYESKEWNYKAAKNLFAAAASFGFKTIVTYPCSDPGYEGVLQAISELKGDEHFFVHKNIENLDFLSLMSGAKAILGNSSSALVEAPYFKLPAVNVGRRQERRDREENVVDSGFETEKIREAISYVLENKSFRKKLEHCGTRLGDGTASEKVLAVIKRIPLDETLLRKKLVV